MQNLPRFLDSDIDRIVASFMENDAAFTAWDITKALRNDFWAPHDEARDAVHVLMEPILDSTAGWSRESNLVSPDGVTTAWIYFNSIEALNGYIDAVQNPVLEDEQDIPLVLSTAVNPVPFDLPLRDEVEDEVPLTTKATQAERTTLVGRLLDFIGF